MTLSTVMQEAGSVVVGAVKENPVAAVAIVVAGVAVGYAGRWLYKRRQAKKAPDALVVGLTNLAEQMQAKATENAATVEQVAGKPLQAVAK